MGRENKRGGQPTPQVPAVPMRGHFVITADEFGVEQWWKIGDVEIILGADAILAMHTRSPVIRRFSRRTFKFAQFSKQTQTPCWKVEE